MSVALAPEATGPSTAAVSTFLLDLHERSNELGHRELQEHALRQLARLVSFDSGLLAMGTIQDGVPHGHDVVLHGCSAEFMASWETVKHEDRVAVWAFGHPGQTGNFAVDGPIFDGLEAAREHCRRYRLAHVLCTSMVSRDTGLYWVMSIYRSDPDRPFLETERQATELLVPHLFAASRRARLVQLRMRADVREAEGEPSAIANQDGLVLEAEPAFTGMLRLGFPAWTGPFLPTELALELRPAAPRMVIRGNVALRVAPANGLFLVQARRRQAADALTPREREVAEAFSLGETHKELAARLKLSPNTVRRHLANVYEKLGISSKAELDRMLR